MMITLAVRSAVAVAIVLLCATTALAWGPTIDYDCAKKCLKSGWEPVCVADGRPYDEGGWGGGTLYANECTWTKCTKPAAPNTRRYTYLPLECWSSVGCSLMGKSVEACRKVWEGSNTEETPLTSIDCSCTRPWYNRRKCAVGKQGCLTCKGGFTCSECASGYRVTQGICQKCTTDNCAACPRDAKTCTSCKRGFRLAGNGKCMRRA